MQISLRDNKSCHKVILWSVILGFLFGIRALPTWTDILEHGQILAKTITYPINTPSAIYYSNAYSLLNHLAAFFISLKYQNFFICYFLQGLDNIVFFLGISLCTFKLSKNIAWSLLLPVLLFFLNFKNYSDAYPFFILGNFASNGDFGLYFTLVILGLFAWRKYIAGSFLLGILPYAHLAFGVSAWFFAFLLIVFNWKKIQIKKTTLIFFSLGAMLTLISFLIHHQLFSITSVFHNTPLADYYYWLHTYNFDYHRTPISFRGFHFYLISLATLLSFYLLINLRTTSIADSLIPIVVITTTFIAIIYSILVSFFGVGIIPKFILEFMPGRYSNIALLLMPSLLLGAYIKKYSSSSFVFLLIFISAPIFAYSNILEENSMLSALIPFAILTGLSFGFLLHATLSEIRDIKINIDNKKYYLNLALFLFSILLLLLELFTLPPITPSQWSNLSSTHINGFHFRFYNSIFLTGIIGLLFLCSKWRFEKFNTLFVSVIAYISYCVATYVLFYPVIKSDRLSVTNLEKTSLHFHPQFPASLDKTGFVLTLPNFYKQAETGNSVIYFFDERTVLSYVPEAGPYLEKIASDLYGWHGLFDISQWGKDTKNIWKNFSKEKWQTLSKNYLISSIVSPCDINLPLKLISKQGKDCIYSTGNTFQLTSSTRIPVLDSIPTNITHYFYIPNPRFSSRGWLGLEVSDDLKSDWNWLDTKGDMMVYAPQTGLFSLHTQLGSLGNLSRKITLMVNNHQAIINIGPSSGFKNYEFEPLYLKKGINVIHISADGPTFLMHDKNASVGFKDVQWVFVNNQDK